MTRIPCISIALFACLFGISESSAAQRPLTPPFSQPVGFHLRGSPEVRAEPGGTQSTVIPRDDHGPNPGLHFLAGAAIGALAAGVTAAIEMSKCNDCMMAPVAEVMAVGAGIVVGGVAGLLVYAWRKEQWQDPDHAKEPQEAR